ncbi:DUF3558 domain-containing protein [Nocardia macrotermitis]|uniref:DUF3558 domain-containing protein n=1 Tax=Nocardia macrotermitis TaxID=2585198 RepID=A0A7K0CY24_9NOCA|nr:DUF3558 domain-containing protein [Nocardia macrotermitis]MQY18343.1 hypothetical protein [Nocardia macrotermitis]
MSQTRKTFGVVALLAAAGLALAGCGKSTTASPTTDVATSASAVASATDPAQPKWDPCTVPDSAVSTLGLDTTSKSDKVSGTTFDGWKVCGWKSSDKTYDFTIFTSHHTLDEYRQRSDYQGFAPTTVGDHQALQYQHAGALNALGCSISVQIPDGTVDFDVLNRYGTPGLGDPCTIVRRLADGLAQYIPSA